MQDNLPPNDKNNPATTPDNDAQKAIVADNKPLVFVVEDDAEAAFIFQRAMEANGCHVEVFQRGDDASTALNTLRPEVVLLDLHLPGKSGVEILREIRANIDLQDTRVILLTADHATADMITASADMTLLKPATFTQVRDLVKRLMKKHK